MKATAYNERIKQTHYCFRPPNSCQQFGYITPIQSAIKYPARVALFTNPGVTKSMTIHPPFVCRITIMDNGPWTMDQGPLTMGNGQKTMDIGQWTMDNTHAPLWNVEQGTSWTEI